jgi:hypothetical protein
MIFQIEKASKAMNETARNMVGAISALWKNWLLTSYLI